MRFIFAVHDRAEQIKKIREGIEDYREGGRSDPQHFEMHPVYDALICQLGDHFLSPWKESMAILGLGGYGRREMSPYSDIDLLFLRPEDAPEGVYRGVRGILYLLWDAKVDLGHAVRTLRECEEEAEKDLAVLTSLMDARFIWGDETIFRSLLIERERMLNESDPVDLYLRIEAELRKSNEGAGQTIYILEPNLKEGPASLRQMQLIGWLARMLFGCESINDLPYLGLTGRQSVEEALAGHAFMSQLRTRLHFLTGRRDDVLNFQAQRALAEQTGFEDTATGKGVEHFMREYYRHAATVDFFGRRMLARARLRLKPEPAEDARRLRLEGDYFVGAGGINRIDLTTTDAKTQELLRAYGIISEDAPDLKRLMSDPKQMLRAFRLIAETGSDLDIRLADVIRKRVRDLEPGYQNDPEVNALFLGMLKTGKAVSRAVTTMMKTGFLETFIPEFADVRFLPQHTMYHQYTVDQHTMGVLAECDAFRHGFTCGKNDLLCTIGGKIDKPELLYLAALFHDIGKGRGGGHEKVGAELAAPVLERMGVDSEDAAVVLYLVRNHLAMSHLAFKKDLHDRALIERFAENVMNSERLDLLMVLTNADLTATGPNAMNSWRKMLLEELYYRTLDELEEESAGGENLADWVSQIKAVVRERVAEEYRGSELDEYLDKAPNRYFLDFYPGLIADHYMDIQRHVERWVTKTLQKEDLITRKVDHRKPGYSSVTVITKDRLGLFHMIAGTLSANKINILAAWSHSIGDDIAIATFHVTEIPEGPLDDPHVWDAFSKDMADVVAGEKDVHALVAARRPAGSTQKSATAPRFPTRVEVDNAASDRGTIVEVYAHDRPALLYDITSCLTVLGLNIVLTKISTEVDQVADVFYVVDENGDKILDFERIDHIRKTLKDHLAAIEAGAHDPGEVVRTITF
jgi:[protein-PII] uridylyltransferase